MKSIGIGFVAVTHPHVYTRADILSKMEGVDLISVWDEEDDDNANTFANRYGVERADSLDALLSDARIDAVIVESWTQNMASLAERCLVAGKAVLLEKPGGNNVAEIEKAAAAAHRTGGYLTIGYMVRQSASQAKLKQILASGILGRITMTRFHVALPAPDPVTPWFNLENDLGGALFEDGCHMVDLIVDLFDAPRAVTATIPKYDDLTKQHGHMYEDGAACTLEWDDKVGALTVAGWEANDWLETWEIAIYGDKGTVVAGPLPDRVSLYLKEPTDGIDAGWTTWNATQFNDSWLDHEAVHVWHAVNHRAFYRKELERFIADLRDGGSPMIPADHAVKVTRTIAAMYEAAREGRRVAL